MKSILSVGMSDRIATGVPTGIRREDWGSVVHPTAVRGSGVPAARARVRFLKPGPGPELLRTGRVDSRGRSKRPASSANIQRYSLTTSSRGHPTGMQRPTARSTFPSGSRHHFVHSATAQTIPRRRRPEHRPTHRVRGSAAVGIPASDRWRPVRVSVTSPRRPRSRCRPLARRRRRQLHIRRCGQVAAPRTATRRLQRLQHHRRDRDGQHDRHGHSFPECEDRAGGPAQRLSGQVGYGFDGRRATGPGSASSRSAAAAICPAHSSLHGDRRMGARGARLSAAERRQDSLQSRERPEFPDQAVTGEDRRGLCCGGGLPVHIETPAVPV